jgi:uncharacterized protein YjbJ (UPF0337 family)
MYGTLVSLENTMDREHIKGATDKAKGAIKETAGKMTGDEKLRAESKLDRAKGAAHKVAGDMKEATHQGPRETTHQGQREGAHHGPKSPHE